MQEKTDYNANQQVFANVSWTFSVVRMSLASFSPTRRVYPGYRAWEGHVRSEPTRRSLARPRANVRLYERECISKEESLKIIAIFVQCQ